MAGLVTHPALTHDVLPQVFEALVGSMQPQDEVGTLGPLVTHAIELGTFHVQLAKPNGPASSRPATAARAQWRRPHGGSGSLELGGHQERYRMRGAIAI